MLCNKSTVNNAVGGGCQVVAFEETVSESEAVVVVTPADKRPSRGYDADYESYDRSGSSGK